MRGVTESLPNSTYPLWFIFSNMYDMTSHSELLFFCNKELSKLEEE